LRVIVARDLAQIGIHRPPGAGQRQQFVAPVGFHLLARQIALLLQRRDGTADLGLVHFRARANGIGGHRAIAAQMEKHPPLGAQHAVAPPVMVLECQARFLGGLIEKVGQEGTDVEIGLVGHAAMMALVSYKFNY